MEIIIIVVGLLLFFNLRGRINRLEKDVAEFRGGATVAHGVSASQPTHAVSAQASPSPEELLSVIREGKVSTTPRGPSWDEAFIAWVKEDWLLKLGAFIVLIGFGWFVSYAFAHNWIDAFGRITLGMILGIGILGFGWFRMHTRAMQGSVFLGLGAMVVLISAFSASYVYHLIPSRASLAIMLLTSAFIALASVRFKVMSLAVTSIIIASLAPSMLLLNATPSYVELFVYLFAVVFGTVWIVSLTGWRSLTGVALVMFLMYSIPHFGMATSESGTLLMIAYAFALLFFITNTIGILKIRDGDIQADAITAVGNGILLLAWILTRAPEEWKSLIIVGWMVLFIVVAFAIFAVTKRREPFFVYAGVGVAMLATATAAELNGAELTIAYIIESAIIPLVAYGIMRDRNIAKGLTLLTAGPAFLSLQSIFANWRQEIPFDHFFVLLLMSATLLLLGVFFLFIHKDGENDGTAQTLFVGGSVYAYILLWLSLHAAMADKDMATMISLVIYTIIGLAVYAYGRIHEIKGLHYYGGVLLAFTVGHLLLIDVWSMELSGRIITFFFVGTLLMMTAFIGRKKHPTVTQ